MSILCFSDILKKVGLDPSTVKLIRHHMASYSFNQCYKCDMVREYTAHQRTNFSKGYLYWAVFIGESGTYARLYSLYKVNGATADTPDTIPDGYPISEQFDGQNMYYDLQYMDLLQEYESKLIIDWGNSARMWHQKGTTEKPIISIESSARKPFIGYEKVLLTYNELKEIVENATDYELWQTALSAINAVYLIVDMETGSQYVGSAYGKDGLLGRWRFYVDSLHGNNKLMKDLICNHPDRYKHFQFSILQILSKSTPDEEIIHAEALWKKKLCSVQFGMNDN
mgnify:FL=1